MQKKFKKNKIKAPKNKTKQTYKKEDKTKRNTLFVIAWVDFHRDNISEEVKQARLYMCRIYQSLLRRVGTKINSFKCVKFACIISKIISTRLLMYVNNDKDQK
jgi:hypothetical protein